MLPTATPWLSFILTCISLICIRLSELFWVNPFPNKSRFLRVCSTSLLKTLWEKEKLLITSNFSFFPQCFLPILENFLPFSSNSKLASANSFSLGESKICRLGEGYDSPIQTGRVYSVLNSIFEKGKQNKTKIQDKVAQISNSRICYFPPKT